MTSNAIWSETVGVITFSLFQSVPFAGADLIDEWKYQSDNIYDIECLRGPTHQKWSNFAILGFIVQFDPWVGRGKKN